MVNWGIAGTMRVTGVAYWTCHFTITKIVILCVISKYFQAVIANHEICAHGDVVRRLRRTKNWISTKCVFTVFKVRLTSTQASIF